MISDIVHEIEAVKREVGSGRIAAGEGRAIRLRRTYEAPIEDVWDALTTPERITRWFLPITGDYRVGGRFQLEGNAGGEILTCERPTIPRHVGLWRGRRPGKHLRARGAAHARRRGFDDARARAHGHRARRGLGEYGPGAVGIGWDQGLLGLSLYLRTGEPWTIPWPGSCPTRDASSRHEAARRGVPRTRLRAPTQRPRRKRSRTLRPSMRRTRSAGLRPARPRPTPLVRFTPGSP